jgi:hypothetical protein
VHAGDATTSARRSNRVFPYVWAGSRSSVASRMPSSARERMPSLR